MKKFILIIAMVLLMVSLIGCGSSPTGDSAVNKEYSVWTFVEYDEEDLPQNETIEKDVPEFKDTKFQCNGETFVAIKDDKETVLISHKDSQSIINVFVADINDDGMPEFCATTSSGFGMIHDQVFVIDYANNEWYQVPATGDYDYSLSIQDEELVITRLEWGQGRENGRLFIKNHQPIIEYANGETETIEFPPHPYE